MHSKRKRADAIALLDSAATENFMNFQYAKWLGLPLQKLPHPRPLLNVDGTYNKAGALQYCTDLGVQTRDKRV